MPAGMAVWPSDLVCRWWTRRAFYLPRPRLPLLPLLGVERSTTWSHTALVGATPERLPGATPLVPPSHRTTPPVEEVVVDWGRLSCERPHTRRRKAVAAGEKGQLARGPRKFTGGTMVAGEHSTAGHSGVPWQAGPGSVTSRASR